MSAKKEDPAVTNFREYLRIKSVHPNPDYEGCVAFLRRMAGELDLPFRTVEMVKDKPIILMTWEGTDPSLPTVLLNSHIDVVPVYPEHWKYDPFAAVKEENGDIYARGTQDMKCVGIQYLEAIRRFKAEGKRFLRTFHLSFVPDEEIGGFDGMKLFIHSDDFKNLNIAFALDEGLANPTDAFTVYYGERSPWCCEYVREYCWEKGSNVEFEKLDPKELDELLELFYVDLRKKGVWVTCSGNPGHGSRFIENTAAEKIQSVINSFLEFRAEEKKKLETDSKLTLGDVTTCNMTMLEGGVQFNVVPTEMSVGFDIRITPTVDMIQLEKRIQSWCDKAGEGVTVSYKQKCDDQSVTPINDANIWWKAFSTACKDRNAILEPEIFPAATDSRYLREIGLPALGFSPMNNTPILLHDHNEFLNENVFLKGIDIYFDILTAVGSVPAQ